MSTRARSEQKDVLKTYALDNSALFYPIMATKKTQSIFRMTAVLNDVADASLLEDAINDTLKRFPTFKTKLKAGYAWWYFEENKNRALVTKFVGSLLSPITAEENNGYLFRFMVDENRVVMELCHVLADGNGGLAFLKAVLYRYRNLQGIVFSSTDGIVDLDAAPTVTEFEDAFRRYYTPIKMGDADIKNLMGEFPMELTGTVSEEGYSCGIFNARYDEMSVLAKKLRVTFTAFVAGNIAEAIKRTENSTRPIALMVPVNLRTLFPSDNLRNFVTFVRLVLHPKKCCSAEEFAVEANKQLKQKTTKEEMNKMISTTVRSERAAILRFSPLWLKTFIAKAVKKVLKSRQTLILSNLGRVTMPKELGVKRMEFYVNVSSRSKVNVGVNTIGENVTITFTRSIVETKLQDAFKYLMQSNGVNVTTL